MLKITETHSSSLPRIYSRPTWVTSVIPVGGIYMNGSVINVLQNIHFPIGTLDIMGLYGLDTATAVDHEFIGWKPRRPRRTSSPALRFSRLVQDASIFLGGDLKELRTSRRKIKNENDVVSDQPIGTATLYRCGSERYYSDHYLFGQEPTHHSKRHRFIAFNWQDELDEWFLHYSKTSTKDITTASIDGLYPSKLTKDVVDGGDYDWRLNGDGLWLYYVSWKGNSISLTYGVAEGTILSGTKKLYVQVMEIDIDVDRKPTFPCLIGQRYDLSLFFNIESTIYTRTIGPVLTGDDIPLEVDRTSVAAALNIEKYMQPHLAILGECEELSQRITFTEPFFERPTATPLLEDVYSISNVHEHLGFSPSSNRYYPNTNVAGFINTATRHKFGALTMYGQMSNDTNTAIEGAMDTMKTNWVESFGEVGTLLDPLISAAALVKFMSNPKRYGYTTVDFFKLLAGNNLGFWFGVAPNLATAAELRNKLKPTSDRVILLDDSTVVVKNTSVFYDQEVEGVGTKVISSAKVHLSYEVSAVIALLITIDNYGLLPRVSRVIQSWPLSFVVDAYSGWTNYVAKVENFLRNGFFNIEYSVCSLNIIYEFSNSDMDVMGLEQAPTNEYASDSFSKQVPGISTFVRYVFADGVPMPLPNDLGGPPRGLPFHIIGSMLISAL